MNHERIRNYINESRVLATVALAVLSDTPAAGDLVSGDYQTVADDQVWTALYEAHEQLTVALAFVNADANRQAQQ